MNWWKRFLSNPYKWGLWHWIGGRPWTYIARDIYHRGEFLVLIFCLLAGFFSGLFYPGIIKWLVSGIFNLLFLVVAVSIAWFIIGHFFWGRKYIAGQK